MLNGISGIYNTYDAYKFDNSSENNRITRGNKYADSNYVDGKLNNGDENVSKTDEVKKSECQTCKDRRYIDGNEQLQYI